MELRRLIHPREQAQQALFLKLAHTCLNNSTETIAGAVINLLITVVHRMSVKQADAEARWDDLFGQGKELLKSKYAKKPGEQDVA
jgi:hypothetical protein